VIERYTLPEMERIWSPENRIKKWIDVEIAVAEAESELGIIPANSFLNIKERLKLDPSYILERMGEVERRVEHEVIAFISVLEDEVGEDGRYIHFGLTSSDIIDTANALLLKESLEKIRESLEGVSGVLMELSLRFKDTPIMGRTHGIYAEPISLGLKFLGYYSESLRNIERLEKAEEQISYGKISGACGTYAYIDPEVEELALKKLGLKPEPVSTQIIPRDRYAFLFSAISLTGAFLERLALEIRLLQRTEVGEIFEPFGREQRGSSAMPHKRNPVKCERITGLSRLLRGYLLSSIENIALWHERDISHSSVERIIIPDAFHILYFMLNETSKILKNLEVDEERIRENMERFGDFYYSEGLLLSLIKKGLKRGDAYEYVKRASLKSIRDKISLKDVVLGDEGIMKILKREEVEKIFSHNFLRNVDLIFRRMKKGS
jgi:adenylosuccinate lyase